MAGAEDRREPDRARGRSRARRWPSPRCATTRASLARERVERYGYRSFLGVPLRRGGEVLGSLEVVTKERRAFAPEDQHLMTAFADQAAVAIDNARLFEETRAHLGRIVEANGAWRTSTGCAASTCAT